MNRRRELVLLVAVAVLYALPLGGGPGFYTVQNFRGLLADNLPVLVAAAGMTLVIVAGQIDISIGSQFVVAGIASGVLARAGWPMPAVVGATLAIGAALGAVNGALVRWAGVPAIIATLATMVIWRSGVRQATGGDWVRDLPASYQWFGAAQAVAQPWYVVAAVAIFAGMAWGARYLAIGRAVYAAGNDAEAARRLGLAPERVTLGVFLAMGVATAAAALLNFTRYPAIETNAGLGLELKVIAAVVVGGTAITGGRGTLAGTALGVVLLGSVGTVFTFLHVNPAWEKALQGAVLLVAVVADTVTRREVRRV